MEAQLPRWLTTAPLGFVSGAHKCCANNSGKPQT
eukprot:COSAG05_NODE_13679_length_421_cov_0.962733_1_plen_33_part_10